MANHILTAIKTAALVNCEPVRLVELTGADAIDLVHRLSTNDVLTCRTGNIAHSSFLDHKGRVVDYATLFIRDNSLLAIVSAANEEKVAHWIERYTIMEDVSVRPVSDAMNLLSLIGPTSTNLLRKMVGMIPDRGQFIEKEHGGGRILIGDRQDFGNERVDLIVPSEIERELIRDAEREDVRILDGDEWEILRIVRGIPQGPNELNSAFNPYEVNLTQTIDFHKGCYVGQEVIARLDTYEKVQRTLMGLVSPDPCSPEELPRSLLDGTGKEVATLTSFSRSMISGLHVGLAVVRKHQIGAGETIFGDEGKLVCRVTELPIPIHSVLETMATGSSVGSPAQGNRS